MDLRFENIYPEATVLDGGFLGNEKGLWLNELQPKEQTTIFRNYYLHMCAAVGQLHYAVGSAKDVEGYLNNVHYGVKLHTSTTDKDERKYLFLQATADQLLYDTSRGRKSITRDEKGRFDIAGDALTKLDLLGFCQRTPTLKW